MTLLDPSQYDPAPLLLVDTVNFPDVLAVPERQAVDGGDLLTFRFANGYGAAVTRMDGCPLLHAFEFCVLDCTQKQARPTFQTPVASDFLSGISREEAAALLVQAERLPRHARLQQADEWLGLQDF